MTAEYKLHKIYEQFQDFNANAKTMDGTDPQLAIGSHHMCLFNYLT